MDKRGKYTVLGAVVLGALFGFGVFVWGESVERKAEVAMKEAARIQGIYGQGSPSAQAPLPNLDRPLVVTASLSPEAKTLNIQKITFYTEKVREGGGLSDWLELGVFRKAIGDLEGAEEIWRYAASAYPSDGISLANLANLYIYEKKDFAKGEEFLLGAIERAPHQVFYYETAYEFYRFMVKNEAKGKEVIRKGMLANPEEPAFKDILSRF